MSLAKTGTSAEVIYFAYALFSATAYVGATVAMKYYDRLGLLKGGAIIVLALVAAVYFETIALRIERFGLILLIILACECALGLLLSWLWFNETYKTTELIGFALIIAGVGLVKA